MSIFNKPTTVSGVFDKAIADVKVIQEKNNKKAQELEKAQSIREADFKRESGINADAKAAAEKESKMAGNAISNFGELFGIEAE